MIVHCTKKLTSRKCSKIIGKVKLDRGGGIAKGEGFGKLTALFCCFVG